MRRKQCGRLNLRCSGLTRSDADTITFTCAKPAATHTLEQQQAIARQGIEDHLESLKTLLIHDFNFNGDPVTTDKIHLRQVAPGVVEITRSVAWEAGYWRFLRARRQPATSAWGSGSIRWTTRTAW